MNSIVKVFNRDSVRFVSHPDSKYEFGIVAEDMAVILEHSNSRVMTESVDSDWKGVSNVDTLGGTQSMTVIWEPGVYELLAKSRKPLAKPFKKWIFEEVIPGIRKTGSYAVNPEPKPARQFIEPEIITAELEAIKFFTGNGDLQLAQLAKSHLGNRYLASQQNLLKPAEVPQYEGVIDVAIRLGFSVPSNYESSLGTHVAKRLKSLAIGQDKRYSNASAKQVGANMYPANHPDVERAVLDYCVSKSFYRREMNWLN